MREALVAVAIFACLAAASLGSLAFYDKLPASHRQDETNNVVRLVANLFVVMTSLVLGLMINSARNTFQSVDDNVHTYATELILLDRTLRQYGPGTDASRESLVAYVQRVTGYVPRRDEMPTVANGLSEVLLNEIGKRLATLNAQAPQDSEHAALYQDARQHLQKVIELRWVLIEQSGSSIPAPLIIMVVAWLVLIFGSFGFRAPRNAIVVGSLVLSAALIAGSLYLIMDMEIPFSGPIQISLAPLQRALVELSR